MTEFVLDDLLDEAVLEGALAAGRDPLLAASQFGVARVIAAGAAAGRRAYFGNAWSDDEEAALRENIVEVGAGEVAARLGRTVSAVQTRRFVMGLPGVTRHPEYITGNGIAEALGMDSHWPLKLIERGLLPVERTPLPGETVVWRMRRTAFYVWATRPENFIYFIRSARQPERIRDEQLRRLVARSAARWGDEWWSIGEAARYHGTMHEVINTYIRRGRLAAVKWGNWWLRRSEVTSLRFYANGAAQFLHRATAVEDAFIVLATAVGVPRTHISRMMRRRTAGGVASRFPAIQAKGLIPWIARVYELPLHYRAEDKAAWCDWRDVAHRFPYLARTWARLKAGGKLGRAERGLLAGVGRAFFSYHLPEHPLASRCRTGDTSMEALREIVALYEETV